MLSQFVKSLRADRQKSRKFFKSEAYINFPSIQHSNASSRDVSLTTSPRLSYAFKDKGVFKKNST